MPTLRSVAPMYSPSTAPRNAVGTAICSALRMPGSAATSRTLRSWVNLPPPKTRMTSRLARSAALKPSSAPTTVVKKTASAARKIAVVDGSPGRVAPPSTTIEMPPTATSGRQ